jgi:hypothetical protein
MSAAPARCGKLMRGQKACGRPAGHGGDHYSEEAWQAQNERLSALRTAKQDQVRTHNANGYNRGCRCEDCTAAHAKRARDRRTAGCAPATMFSERLAG